MTAVSQVYFYQMCQLHVVQRSLTKNALRSLVQAFIHCCLVYCNAVLAGTAADIQTKLPQSIQNTAARLLSGARRRGSYHSNPTLASSAAEDRFQDCDPCVEMCSCRRSWPSLYLQELSAYQLKMV